MIKVIRHRNERGKTASYARRRAQRLLNRKKKLLNYWTDTTYGARFES